jgi:hypothetical protein
MGQGGLQPEDRRRERTLATRLKFMKKLPTEILIYKIKEDPPLPGGGCQETPEDVHI